jgi:hypothetical protein
MGTPQTVCRSVPALRPLVPMALVLCGVLLGCSADSRPQMSDEAEIFGWIEDVVAFGVRMPGTLASVQAAQYVHDRFVELGLSDVAIERTDTIVWSADQWGLSVEGEDVPAYFMQHTFIDGTPGAFTTGPDGLTAEIVYVGDGTVGDFNAVDVEGKIVLADVRWHRFTAALLEVFTFGIHDPDGTLDEDFELVDPYSRLTFPFNYYRARERGAVGFIGILTDYLDRHEYHNEAYQSYREGGAMRIPGLWVSPSTGAALAHRIDTADEPLIANLVLEGQLAPQEGLNVVGYLPGRSDEIIMVQSHHDSNTVGATEDASGTALVLALAKYHAQQAPEERPRTLLFTTMDTHFTDYASHYAFIERHIEQEDILANLTLEHIAKEVVQGEDDWVFTGHSAPKALFVTTEVEGLADVALEAIRAHDVARTGGMAANNLVVGLPADSSHFHRAGVPVVALVGAPIYLYDSIDTLDKVEREQLVPVAEASVDILRHMGTMPRSLFEAWNPP